MGKLLLRFFVREKEVDSPRYRAQVGRLSGLVGIVCNLLLFAGKLLIGTLSGSVSITADAMNNLTDASSSVVTLIGFKLAEKPADDDHPYGHARFEYLSGLAVAALIVVIGAELARSSIHKILSPEAVTVGIPLVAVLLLSIAGKLWLMLFNRKLSKMIGSGALLATASDSRNDVIATTAVLVAALVEHITTWQVDGYMGLAVALFILYSGVMLAKETISPLLGENADPVLRQSIAETISSHPMVLGYHDLMVHDYGPGQRFASLHVEMDQAEDPLLCHDVIDDLERTCLKLHQVHLVIHYDPVITGDEELSRMRALVAEILFRFDSRLSIHDFRMVRGTTHTNLIFDMVVPQALKSRESEIKAYLDDALQESGDTTYYTVITFDVDAFNRE